MIGPTPSERAAYKLGWLPPFGDPVPVWISGGHAAAPGYAYRRGIGLVHYGWLQPRGISDLETGRVETFDSVHWVSAPAERTALLPRTEVSEDDQRIVREIALGHLRRLTLVYPADPESPGHIERVEDFCQGWPPCGGCYGCRGYGDEELTESKVWWSGPGPDVLVMASPGRFEANQRCV